jgi:biotin carboxyl carrier protein
MRRYSLDIGGRNFVIDVQELAVDLFEVVVGDASYQVTLSNDENLSEAVITPDFQPGAMQRGTTADSVERVRKAPVCAPAASLPPRQPSAGAGGNGAVTAPMPGAILEVKVKAGDQIVRGQQVAVLDAMKMHNLIGSPRAGTVAEVCVAVGQNVDHGDAIIKFQED